MVKSFRSSGTSTAARTARRSSRLPWKYFSSVRTEIAWAPWLAYAVATVTGSRPRASTPREGDAFFTSAISRTAPGRGQRAPSKSRAGGASRHCRSRPARGMAARRRATSLRVLPTISSRTDIGRRLVVAPESLPPQRVEWDRSELIEDEVAERTRRRQVAYDPSRLDQRLQQRLPGHTVGRPPAGRQHNRLARAAAPVHVLGARPLAPLGRGLPLDLHDVQGEVEHRRVGDRGADAVAVGDRIQRENLVLVDAAGGENLDVVVAAQVELPANLFDNAVKVAATRRRRVQADGVEILTEGLGDTDRLELLVLQRVDERDTANLRVDDRIEGPQGLHRVADHEDERVRDRPHGIGLDQLGGLRHRDAVTSTDERVALDHRRQRRVHAPRPEGDHLALARRLLAARRLCGDARRLAEEAEQRRLVLGPFDVCALDAEHGLLRLAEDPLVHCPHVHRLTFEEGRSFLDAGENTPLPVLREGLQIDLGLDSLAVAAMGQDLHRAREVDVGHLAALDVGVGGGVKRALRSIRHSVCALRTTPKVAKSVAEARSQVKLGPRSIVGSGRGGGRDDHAARVRCPGAAGLQPGAALPSARGGDGSLRPPPRPDPTIDRAGAVFLQGRLCLAIEGFQVGTELVGQVGTREGELDGRLEEPELVAGVVASALELDG